MDGSTYYQRNCERLKRKAKEWRANNRQKHNEYSKNYVKQRRTTPEGRASHMVAAAKQRSKGKPFDITVEWLEQKLKDGICEVSGLPFVFDNAGGKWQQKHPFSPSLDQKNPGAGYTTENTQVVVWIYNIAKSHWSHDDVIRLSLALTSK